MKKALFIVIGGLLATVGCQRELSPVTSGGEPVNVSFQVGVAGETKAIGDGSEALRLTLRIYDQQGNFVQESTADREESESGWTVSAAIVPGTYSFCFWASSPDSGVYGFDGQYLTVDYSKVTLNSDVDDAFWAVLAGEEVTAAFSKAVTLSRPLSLVTLYSKDDSMDLGESDLNDESKFVSSLTLKGGIPARMNLLDGSTDEAQTQVAFAEAPLAELETDATYGTALIFAYVLVPADGITLSEVDYSATLKKVTPEKDLASGSVPDVQLARNKRTLLLYAPQPAPVPEAVDLGLPSGLLWASFNLGATAPEEYGGYYAWGETETKENYDLASYKWFKNGNDEQLTRYCPSDKTDYWDGEGDPDGKTEFKDYDYADDAARKVLGGKWRMPTDGEWQELRDNCSSSWSTRNGVNGFLFTATNGNSIFLPAAGWSSASLFDDGSLGYYWSSSLDADRPYNALGVYFHSGGVYRYYDCRYYGQSVRPVQEPEQPKPDAVDLGLPSGLKWASFNLGATAPEEYGDYYAWGETETKESYDWASYKWCNGSSNSLTRYCPSDKTDYWGGEGNPDNKLSFKDYDYADDAARKVLGGKWRMPTDGEWQELMDYCTSSWTTQNNVNGYLFTASNGNSVFLPAAGYRNDANLIDDGSYGFYWSSSLYESDSDYACHACFDSGGADRDGGIRYYGQPVRPVTE